MSSCTYVEWHYLAHDDFDMASISKQIDALVRKLGWPWKTAANLKELFESGEVKLPLDSDSAIEIVAEIAKLAPKVSFAVRGLGEAPRTVWVREYRGGHERFAFGPPRSADKAARRLDAAASPGGTPAAKAPARVLRSLRARDRSGPFER